MHLHTIRVCPFSLFISGFSNFFLPHLFSNLTQLSPIVRKLGNTSFGEWHRLDLQPTHNYNHVLSPGRTVCMCSKNVHQGEYRLTWMSSVPTYRPVLLRDEIGNDTLITGTRKNPNKIGFVDQKLCGCTILHVLGRRRYASSKQC